MVLSEMGYGDETVWVDADFPIRNVASDACKPMVLKPPNC